MLNRYCGRGSAAYAASNACAASAKRPSLYACWPAADARSAAGVARAGVATIDAARRMRIARSRMLVGHQAVVVDRDDELVRSIRRGRRCVGRVRVVAHRLLVVHDVMRG